MASPERSASISPHDAWLERLLRRQSGCEYLSNYRHPKDLRAFREQIPIVDYDDIDSMIQRIAAGESNLLFHGNPCAFELTGGSSGGPKLIPYTEDGLTDFQRAVAPWLASVVEAYAITGSAYFSISPATRIVRSIGNIPLGLPDGAYLGSTWGMWLATHSAVPLDVALETNINTWRFRTLDALTNASDLELISVWSPTFLLQLLDELPSPTDIWPRLKVISCWASGSSRAFADELRARVPHARVQPKGLLSTECVTTVPALDNRAILNPHGFFEFDSGSSICLASEVKIGKSYEVIATTASGLYRYRTRDRVHCIGFGNEGMPAFEFVGRSGIVSDLVGEKLTDEFVSSALEKAQIAGFRLVAPLDSGEGYCLFTGENSSVNLELLDRQLRENPQYDYARKLGQLRQVCHQRIPDFREAYTARQIARGVRLGDIKPVSLVLDTQWCTTRISA